MNLKNFGISFSYAHLILCFFFILSTGSGYMFPTAECIKEIGAFFVLLTILTLIFYKFLFLNSKVLYLIHLLFVYIVFRGVKAMFRFQFGANLKSIIFFICILSLSLIMLYLYQKKRKTFVFVTRNLLIFFIPFALISVFKLSASLIALQKNIPLKEYQTVEKQPKIFWIIFDELDQYLTFENPKRPYFKELNHFKNAAVFATKALQAGHCTNVSLPALTTGLVVNDVILNSPFHLKLLLASKSSVDWKNTANIFKKAYNLGYNSALIGWYHPYDRIFAADVAYLGLESSFSKEIERNRLNAFLASVINQFFAFLNYNFDKLFQLFINKSFIPPALIKTKHPARDAVWYENLLKHLESVIDNDQLNFSFFHLPIPHYPTCYNSKTQKIESTAPNYYENVFLVDRTLGWLRKKLTQKNLWDSSIIIITSDHWLRTEKGFIDQYLEQEATAFKKQLKKRNKPYVPFLIKMPHQKKMLQIDKEFNSLILHDLVLEMMKKQIRNEKDVINRINEFFVD